MNLYFLLKMSSDFCQVFEKYYSVRSSLNGDVRGFMFFNPTQLKLKTLISNLLFIFSTKVSDQFSTVG